RGGEELVERAEGAADGKGGGEEEDPIPEDVEGVEEREGLEVAAQGQGVLAAEEAEVVRELPDVLIQDVVDGERLVAQRGVADSPFPNFDGGEVLAEGLPEITVSVVAGEKRLANAVARLFTCRAKEWRLLLIA